MTIAPEAVPAAHHVRRLDLAGLGACVAGDGVIAAGAASGRTATVAAAALLQAGLLVGWGRSVAPPGPLAVLVVAAGVAAAADVVGYRSGSAAGIAGVLALGAVATIVAQLARGVARTHVVEAFAATLALCACVAAFALLPIAVRHRGADPLLLVAAAAGTALVIGRVADLVVVWPGVLRDIGRGAVGLVVGTAAGAGAALLCAAGQTGGAALDPVRAVVLGAVVALVAVLVDIAGLCLLADATSRRGFGAVLGPMLALMSALVLAYAYRSHAFA